MFAILRYFVPLAKTHLKVRDLNLIFTNAKWIDWTHHYTNQTVGKYHSALLKSAKNSSGIHVCPQPAPGARLPTECVGIGEHSNPGRGWGRRRKTERQEEIRDGKVALDLQVQILLVKLQLSKFQTGIKQFLPSQASPYLKHPCYSWFEPDFLLEKH